MKKQQRQMTVLIPSMMNSANYSKSKNMSVGTVCKKRLKFASPETVSLIICQWSIADMQVPPIEATIYQKISPEGSPEPSCQSRDTPSHALPLHWYSQCHCNFLCINHLQASRRWRSYLLQSNRQGLIQFVFFSSADPDH